MCINSLAAIYIKDMECFCPSIANKMSTNYGKTKHTILWNNSFVWMAMHNEIQLWNLLRISISGRSRVTSFVEPLTSEQTKNQTPFGCSWTVLFQSPKVSGSPHSVKCIIRATSRASLLHAFEEWRSRDKTIFLSRSSLQKKGEKKVNTLCKVLLHHALKVCGYRRKNKDYQAWTFETI